MFIGALPRPLAGHIARGLKALGKPVAIGCSGAFTVERALIGSGLEVASNDISLFSSAIGAAILDPRGTPIATPREDWLSPFCSCAEDLAATVLVLSGNYDHRDNALAVARRSALVSSFGGLHEKTLAKLRSTLQGLRSVVRHYTLGDISEHFARYGDGWASYAFMPTYLGGYERLWRPLESLFNWNMPAVPPLTDERKAEIASGMVSRGNYLFVDDNERIGNAIGARLAMIYHRADKRTIYAYSDFMEAGCYTERTNHSVCPVAIATELRKGDEIGLTLLTSEQARYVRGILTSARVGKTAHSAVGGLVNIGVVTARGLLGAFGVALTRYKGMGSSSAYLVYDLAVPGVHPRLSKLIIMLALTREANAAVSAGLKHAHFDKITTTAFTDKPVSMKYRGVMKLVNRGDGYINYEASFVDITIREVVEQWWTKYGN